MNGLVRGQTTVTTISTKNGVRAGDRLNRQFTALRPNHSWASDFTYVATWAGFVYVAFAIDLFSRAIVGWQASMVKDTSFVEACLRIELWRRDHARRPIEPGMIHHSDAGSQGTSIRFTETVMALFGNEAISNNSPFRTGPLKGLPEIVFDWISRYDNSGPAASSGTCHPGNTRVAITLRQPARQRTKPQPPELTLASFTLTNSGCTAERCLHSASAQQRNSATAQQRQSFAHCNF